MTGFWRIFVHPKVAPSTNNSIGNVPTWRIIPVSKWLVTPIYKPFRPFGRGTLPYLGDLLTMVINHLLNGMILQVCAFTRWTLLALGVSMPPTSTIQWNGLFGKVDSEMSQNFRGYIYKIHIYIHIYIHIIHFIIFPIKIRCKQNASLRNLLLRCVLNSQKTTTFPERMMNPTW